MKDDEKQINFSLVDLFFLGGGYKIFDSTHLNQFHKLNP